MEEPNNYNTGQCVISDTARTKSSPAVKDTAKNSNIQGPLDHCHSLGFARTRLLFLNKDKPSVSRSNFEGKYVFTLIPPYELCTNTQYRCIRYHPYYFSRLASAEVQSIPVFNAIPQIYTRLLGYVSSTSIYRI